MKRRIAKTLALLLTLCMLIPQTVLAATTYYIDVEITGPDAAGVERTVSGSSSRYGTRSTPLVAELVTVVNDGYGQLEQTYGGTALRHIVDEGLDAFGNGASAWESYVDAYYEGDGALENILRDTSSTFSDLSVGQPNRLTYAADGRSYTVTITLRSHTIGGSGSSGGSDHGGSGQHRVTAADTPFADVYLDPDRASEGREVEVTVVPADGYVLKDLTVSDEDGDDVPVSREGRNIFSFDMPDSDVTVSAEAVAGPDMTGISGMLNTDQDAAYMQGGSDGCFRPASPVTRGQVAMIFYRLLKDRTASGQSTFTDVPDDLWCADAVNTLAALGIVNGVTETTFAPDRPITRAQFVAICARFTELSARGEAFADVPESYWAYDAISTATTYGWVDGGGGEVLAPDRSITRAQAAAIINRMLGREMAGETYEDARRYLDVPETYWAWKDICEASDGIVLS